MVGFPRPNAHAPCKHQMNTSSTAIIYRLDGLNRVISIRVQSWPLQRIYVGAFPKKKPSNLSVSPRGREVEWTRPCIIARLDVCPGIYKEVYHATSMG